jgi:hypothetical protein
MVSQVKRTPTAKDHRCGDNFLYSFKGAPAARQRRTQTQRRKREVTEGECVN